jgi:hypothetical protein
MSSSPIPAVVSPARGQYLFDLLSQVPDPRKKRGRRHPLAGLLAVGIAAVVAGSRSFAAIGQRAADAGTGVLDILGAADESTFRRAQAIENPALGQDPRDINSDERPRPPGPPHHHTPSNPMIDFAGSLGPFGIHP